MPGQIRHSVNLLIDKVKNKEMDISLLDQSVRRILKTIEKTRIEERKEADFKKDYDLAVEAVENSAVLLKNDDDILPLKKEEKYIVIGDFFDTEVGPLNTVENCRRSIKTSAADLRIVDDKGAVRHTVVDGKVVVRDGKLVHGDIDEIRADAKKQANRLWEAMLKYPETYTYHYDD